MRTMRSLGLSISCVAIATVLLSLAMDGQACAGVMHSVYYDIANSNQSQGPLSPQYDDNSQACATASLLSPVGLSLSNFSDTGGLGKYWFCGWSTTYPGYGSPNIEFSIAPVVPIQAMSLKYTLFVGIWSGLWSGPTHFDVWASTDGFATATQVGGHVAYGDYWYVYPWADANRTFTENLSSLGTVNPGQTLSVRFVGWGEAPSNAGTPAGFSNRFADESNVILTYTAVPEPSGLGMILLFGTWLLLLERRKRPAVAA